MSETQQQSRVEAPAAAPAASRPRPEAKAQPAAGVQLAWGYGRVPRLPEGWMVLRGPRQPAVAVAPSGLEYLVGDGVLYPWARADGEQGKRRLDVAGAVPWPKAEGAGK